MVLLDSVGAELVRRHGGPGDKFTSGAAGRLVCAREPLNSAFLDGGAHLEAVQTGGGFVRYDALLVADDLTPATRATREQYQRDDARYPGTRVGGARGERWLRV
jgi:hypothetical protein